MKATVEIFKDTTDGLFKTRIPGGSRMVLSATYQTLDSAIAGERRGAKEFDLPFHAVYVGEGG